MQVIAPAKINLSLRVLGRRSDGFHEIETLIAPISLCDEIKIEQRSGKHLIAFHCDDPSMPKGEDNIVVRAAKVFCEETKINSGFRSRWKKEFHKAPVWVEEAVSCFHSAGAQRTVRGEFAP